jgi:putative addiction module killer protein
MCYEIVGTSIFEAWLKKLNDRATKNKVLARLARVENGNFGDFKKLEDNLF